MVYFIFIAKITKNCFFLLTLFWSFLVSNFDKDGALGFRGDPQSYSVYYQGLIKQYQSINAAMDQKIFTLRKSKKGLKREVRELKSINEELSTAFARLREETGAILQALLHMMTLYANFSSIPLQKKLKTVVRAIDIFFKLIFVRLA